MLVLCRDHGFRLVAECNGNLPHCYFRGPSIGPILILRKDSEDTSGA